MSPERPPEPWRSRLSGLANRRRRRRTTRSFRLGPLAVAAEYRHLLEARLEGVVPVDQPLVLITQAQRSGGTLLLRLLDGHPECHVVPFQMRGVDEALKYPLGDAERAWAAFYDPKLAERFRSGYRQRKRDVLREEERFSFLLPPGLQRAVFDELVGRLDRPPGNRELLRCYLTAYLNAWLDNRNLRGETKRWVVGFEPGVARGAARRARFPALHPDGRVISIVRDPWSWYASARRWEERWQNREQAIDHWCRVAVGTIKWRKKALGRLCILSFEDLLLRPEETVRNLAGWLGIEVVPGLLEPTFNGLPIAANTSFGDVATEISTKPLERAQAELDDDDVAYIERRARALYDRLLKWARGQWSRPVR